MLSMVADWQQSGKVRKLTARKMGSTKGPSIIGFRALKKMTQQPGAAL